MLRALARVDLAAIERNAALLARAAAPAALCAVVKADGYGHGAVPAARAAQAGGARWLAVATAAEAAELRGAGIGGPLLVMGALSPEELTVALRARADVVVWRQATVAELAEHPDADAAGIHVKLDSGMGRLGTRDAAEAERVAAAVAAAPRLRLAGRDDALRDRRRRPGLRARAARPLPGLGRAAAGAPRRPAAARRELRRHARDPGGAAGPRPLRDRASTAWTRSATTPPGTGSRRRSSSRSYLAEVKPIAPGESAGYGRRFVAAAPTWIGTVPIGYGDGVRRALTNDCDVLVGGRRVPVVGTVSMDNITVDLGPDPPRAGRGGRAARRARAASACSPRSGRGGWRRSTTRSPAGSARGCRASTTAAGRRRDARSTTRARCSPARRPGSSAARSATGCSAARRPTSTSPCRRTRRTRRGRSRATTGGAAFRLSGAFGAWRVVGDRGAWHVDLVVLRDGDIGADLAARDFTVNAMAEPLAGGELLDPHGGRADLDARRLRMVGAVRARRRPAARAARRAARDRPRPDDRAGHGGGDDAARRRGWSGSRPSAIFGELKQVDRLARRSAPAWR